MHKISIYFVLFLFCVNLGYADSNNSSNGSSNSASMLSSMFGAEALAKKEVLELDGRYTFKMMSGRAVVNNRVPSVILDKIRGEVWTCQNLQDTIPTWTRWKLAPLQDNPGKKKKYIVKMLEWQDANLRMPAIVLDTLRGVVWNCPNIIDGKAIWLENKLAGLTKDSEIENRFVLRIMYGRAVKNTRIPAIVLDSIEGIIWTCQNLQDSKPLWVRWDLAKGENTEGKQRYMLKMLEWQDADLRMPAMVLDIEKGVVWNCPNIVDGKAIWVRTDLLKL